MLGIGADIAPEKRACRPIDELAMPIYMLTKRLHPELFEIRH